MKLFPKLLLAAAGCLLAWGISVKAGHRPPRPQVPAGVTLATFETLSDLDLNSGFSQRRPGDILKRMPRSIISMAGLPAMHTSTTSQSWSGRP